MIGRITMETTKFEVSGQKMIYYMPREIDHHAAKDLTQMMDLLIDAHGIRELVFDFKETEFMDSSGIGVLIGRTKKLKLYQGDVRAIHMGMRVQKIFRCAGLYQIIKEEENE